jgi:hypothetical protein
VSQNPKIIPANISLGNCETKTKLVRIDNKKPMKAVISGINVIANPEVLNQLTKTR